MTVTAETCTCGTELVVKGRLHDGTPVTWCPHCDVPLQHQHDHPPKGLPCARCFRYDHHVLRIFPPTG